MKNINNKSKNNYKVVAVTNETWLKLNGMKEDPSDTFDIILQKLLDSYKPKLTQ